MEVQGERHLRNIRQLTFGGQNAEAYFSFDGTRIIFQSTRGDMKCDQQFTMNVVLKRVARQGDLWAPVLTGKVKLPF